MDIEIQCSQRIDGKRLIRGYSVHKNRCRVFFGIMYRSVGNPEAMGYPLGSVPAGSGGLLARRAKDSEKKRRKCARVISASLPHIKPEDVGM